MNNFEFKENESKKLEAVGLEWSELFTELSRRMAEQKLKEINSKLSEGDIKWRFPKIEELVKLRNLFKQSGGSEFFEGGIGAERWYWAEEKDGDYAAWVSMSGGDEKSIMDKGFVGEGARNDLRFVKDIQ